MSSMMAQQGYADSRMRIDHLYLIALRLLWCSTSTMPIHAVHGRANLVAHGGKESRLGSLATSAPACQFPDRRCVPFHLVFQRSLRRKCQRLTFFFLSF